MSKGSKDGMYHALNGNMAMYVEDAMEIEKPWKRWRYDSNGRGWNRCVIPPEWSPSTKYEHIPQTIRIGDREVPAPYRGPMMEMGQRYWVADITLACKHVRYTWYGDTADNRHMERGLIHLTQDDALETADALLALLKEQGNERYT